MKHLTSCRSPVRRWRRTYFTWATHAWWSCRSAHWRRLGHFNPRHYQTPHFERSPYTPTLRSVYHVRQIEVFRMGLLGSTKVEGNGTPEPRRLDVFLSHDWPQGIAFYGNVHNLCVESHTSGGDRRWQPREPPMAHLLHSSPVTGFQHLHVKFAAVVNHFPEVLLSLAIRNSSIPLACCPVKLRPRATRGKSVELW